MSLSDPISDMLTRIRNGQMAKLATVHVSFSKTKEAILKVLHEEGYISTYEIKDGESFKIIQIKLKYFNNRPAIKEINRVSKPGSRTYFSVEKLKSKKFYNGLGMYIVTTSLGVISDKEAKQKNVSGEILCNVY